MVKRFIVCRAAGKRNPDGSRTPDLGRILWSLRVCKIYANRRKYPRVSYEPEPEPLDGRPDRSPELRRWRALNRPACPASGGERENEALDIEGE